MKDQKVTFFNELKKTATKTPSGFKFKIIQKSTGDKPKDGETVNIEYAGFLEDGTLFDTSSPIVAKQFGMFNEQRAMQNGYSALPYVIGSNRMIPRLKGIKKTAFSPIFNLLNPSTNPGIILLEPIT